MLLGSEETLVQVNRRCVPLDRVIVERTGGRTQNQLLVNAVCSLGGFKHTASLQTRSDQRCRPTPTHPDEDNPTTDGALSQSEGRAAEPPRPGAGLR